MTETWETASRLQVAICTVVRNFVRVRMSRQLTDPCMAKIVRGNTKARQCLSAPCLDQL